MSFSVTKTATQLVKPSMLDPTAPCSTLPLSFMDRSSDLRFHVEFMLVFRNGRHPARAIKQALSKTLVPYYPLAGRVSESGAGGELKVACTGEGVWFVEASAGCSLGDVGYLQATPLIIPKEHLLPFLAQEVDQSDATFLMQVTEFICGGFAVGIMFHHAIFDGIGAAQFIKAIAEITGGITQPTVKPIWCRESIPTPPRLPQVFRNSSSRLPLKQCTIDISSNHINNLKDQFAKQTGHRCSMFDVLSAKVWQSRTRAIDHDSQDNVSLSITANARHLIHGVLPKEGGYYGNCTCSILITAPSGQIANASLFEIVELVRGAKERMGTKFARFLAGDVQEDSEHDYGLMQISDWRRVGFHEVDYGWGAPISVVPLNDCNYVAVCILVNSPAPRQGVRLVTWCVLKEHLEAFRDQMERKHSDH